MTDKWRLAELFFAGVVAVFTLVLELYRFSNMMLPIKLRGAPCKLINLLEML